MAEGTKAETVERPAPPSYLQMTTLVPGVAALGLALLYATGALIKTAQLRDHEIRVQDALPLVPIEQLLAIGIGTLMTSLGIVLGWVALVAGFSYFAHRRKVRGKAKEPDRLVIANRRLYLLVKGLIWALLGAIVIWFLFSDSLFGAIATLAPAWVIGDVLRAQERGDVKRVAFLLTAAYLVVVSARIGETWVSPAPFPNAVIETEDGTIQAGLITARGDAWYVTAERGSFESIRADRIVSASVETVPREDEPFLWWPFDWP